MKKIQRKKKELNKNIQIQNRKWKFYMRKKEYLQLMKNMNRSNKKKKRLKNNQRKQILN